MGGIPNGSSATPAPAIAAPTARATAVTLPIVLDEHFATPPQGWPNDVDGVAWHADGAYHLASRQDVHFVALGAPLIGALGDTVVSATFRKSGGPPGGGYGLIVHDQNPDSRGDGTNQGGRFIVAEIGDAGTIGIWRREDDHWVDLLPWMPSTAVHAGDASNELTVQTLGDDITLLANGTQVAHAAMGLDKGGVGVFVGGDSNQVLLERFTVRTDNAQVRARPTSPPPTATTRPVPPTATPLPSEEVVVTGRQSMKTKPFSLRGGSYTIGWEGVPATSPENCIGRIVPVSSGLGEGFVNLIIRERERGETQLYQVKPGDYYIDMVACGDWKVVLLPLGSDTGPILDAVPDAVIASAAAVEDKRWTVNFDHSESTSQRLVSNDAGVVHSQTATGNYLRIYFGARNTKGTSNPLSASDVSLSDSQGRTYSSDFELRQTQPGGLTQEFSGRVAPGSSAQLSLTFDVAKDAVGLVLHVRGGNDVQVK